MLLHIIAFAFHRKVFDDRINTLRHNLKVIDHLRDYRPKRQPGRQPIHRPVFSLAGLVTPSPGHEKSGFNLGLSGGPAHEKEASFHHTHKKRATTLVPGVFSMDEGRKGDIEEGTSHRPQRSGKGKERRSWVFPSRFSSRQDIQNAIERLPDTSLPGHLYQQRHGHTYPPMLPEQSTSSGSARDTHQAGHSNEDPAIVFQAAKALKTAVLHDARNITGKADGPAGLGWNVNSAYQAKVCRFHCESLPFSYTSSYSALRVPSTLPLKSTTGGIISSHLTSTLPTQNARTRRTRSKYSIKTTTATSLVRKSKLWYSKCIKTVGR